MKEGNLGIIICFIVVILPMIKASFNALRRSGFENTLDEIAASIGTVVAVLVMFKFFNIINSKIDSFTESFNKGIIGDFIIKVLLLIMIFALISFIVHRIFRVINRCFLNNLLKTVENNGMLKLLISLVLGFIKGIITLGIIFVLVIVVNKSGVINKNIEVFNNIRMYNFLENKIDEQQISNIKSGLLKDSKIPTIVYYNGVTLEEGVKSNNEIDNKARELTKNAKSEIEKAKILYAYVGSHINYDDEKADMVMKGERKVQSGAREAYNQKSGICFDYACLYAAMARAVNLPVRIVTGTAFNGEEYISHAWNQVYIKDLKKWINVDPTFYKSGDYFNNKDFNKDHKEEAVIGEWQ